jgi:heptosyltransferase-2
MGVSDEAKKRNTQTYQSIMGDILGLPPGSLRYVFHLTPDETAQAERQLHSLGVQPGVAVVGLATGAGGRWPLKQWREDGFADLIGRLLATQAGKAQVVLLGGPEEREKNARLKRLLGSSVIDTGSDNPLRRFAGLIGHCDVVVTGDTLAMHLALAQGRRTVVLFGPTSRHEIELFGLGEKVYPAMDCLCCYLTACDKKPNCMDEITTSMVHAAVTAQLAHARRAA